MTILVIIMIVLVLVCCIQTIVKQHRENRNRRNSPNTRTEVERIHGDRVKRWGNVAKSGKIIFVITNRVSMLRTHGCVLRFLEKTQQTVSS